MKNKTELTLEERNEIEILKNKKYSCRDIARTLERSPNTISYEIIHNSVNGIYTAKRAHEKARLKKKGRRFNYTKIEKYPDLKAFIIKKLKATWNPDEIAGYLKRNHTKYPWYVSKTAIYEWLRTSRGERYCTYLYTQRTRVKKRKPKTKRVMIPERVAIHQRSAGARNRTRYGHWEADAVVSKRGTTGGVSTLMERKSRLYAVRKTGSMRSCVHARAQKHLLRDKRKVRSVTYDNGIENRQHMTLGVPTFFCDPYSSWQKGSNENGNKLLRRFFPKGTDFNKISQKMIDAKVRLINEKPRRILGFRSAIEVAREAGIIEVNYK